LHNKVDIIVVGAGHNGLAAATYLSRSGLSVVVLEKTQCVGGYAATNEPLLCGFRHSPHANYLAFCDIMPMLADFSLFERGLQVLYPDAQFGIAFRNGRPPVILHRPDLLQRTVASFAAYSKKDARTYSEVKRRSATLGSVIRRGLFTAPNAHWFAEQRSAVQRAFGELCAPSSLGSRSARQIIDELFRSAEVRMLMYQLAIDYGIALEEIGGDLAFLGFALWIAGRWRLPVGGMQSVSDALLRAATEAGVIVCTGCCAQHILVDAGKAIGVLAGDGTQILADKAVFAAVPLQTAMSELLDTDSLSADEQSDLREFKREQDGGSIATTMFCLDDRPLYKSARHDPDIDRCFKTSIGYDSPEDIVRSACENAAGLLPRPAGTIRVNTVWDIRQAPQGKHVAGVDSTFPALSKMSAQLWQQVEQSFGDAFFDEWRGYTHNLRTEFNLGALCDATSRFERRMLLRMGPAQYRTSVNQLYVCGPGTYPGGGVHGANAYNAFQVVMSDLGIETKFALD
jgi:phytoene dehydrogenase-like protein